MVLSSVFVKVLCYLNLKFNRKYNFLLNLNKTKLMQNSSGLFVQFGLYSLLFHCQCIFYSLLIFVVELVSCFYLDCDAGLQSLFVC